MHADTVASTTDPVSQLIVGALIVGLFGVLALEKAHRVLVVMTAVAILWAVTSLPPYTPLPLEATAAALDLNVLLLLAAMMALMGVLKETGVFAWAVERLLERFGGDPARAIAVLWWFTAISSAFVDNVTTVIFVTPIVLATVKRLGAPPLLVLLPTIMAANIGGTATLIGDPPNIMIGSGAGLSFSDFLIHLAAPVLLMMVTLQWFAARWFRDDLAAKAPRTVGDPSAAPAEIRIVDPTLLRGMGWICAGILVGFLTHGITGMPAAIPATIGAAAALVLQDVLYLRRHDASLEERRHGILGVLEHEIEWPTLVFFAFLFIVVGAAVETGLIGTLAGSLGSVIEQGRATFGLGEHGTLLLAALIVLWTAGLLSGLIDNIPFVAVSIPILHGLIPTLPGDGTILWWALALGACLGGNATPIGASANVTTLDLAARQQMRITFLEFVRFGAPTAAITLVIGSAWLAAMIFFGHATATVGSLVFAALFALTLRLRRA